MIVSECDEWLIEWGPGSPRPDHFMLYCGGNSDTYVGSFLKLQRAIRAAVRQGGRPLAWEISMPSARPSRSPAEAGNYRASGGTYPLS